MQQPARVILHLDMDAFYAAVEVRDHPELAGKPLIIGHAGRRGVVSTCSYEARKYGVHSAMPSVTATRLCPDAVWRPGRMKAYVAASREIRRILDDYSPLIQPLSIDEAFIDLTGIVPDLSGGAATAKTTIQSRIAKSQRLGASVGVAPNKFLAKIASDMDKPNGLVVLPMSAVPKMLWPLPIERLWGVGPSTARRLHDGGISTVGDLHAAGPLRLEPLVGAGAAAHFCALAEGRDERPVTSGRQAKSISEERTYGEDLRAEEEIDRALLARAEGVARQLRREGLAGRTVQLKVRTGDFTTWTRSLTLAEPTDLAEPLLDAGRQMFSQRIRLEGKGVRLLGLGVSGLAQAGAGQGALFSDPQEQRARRIAQATDAVRDKLGEDAVTRARLLKRGKRGATDGPDEASSLPSVD